MADQQNIDRLRRSVVEWNDWRKAAGDRYLDLSGTDLTATDFPYMAGSADDPYDGYLSEIDLSHTDLSRSRLTGLCVKDADFSYANLQGTALRGSRFVRVRFRGANLCEADLAGAEVVECDFEGALMELPLPVESRLARSAGRGPRSGDPGSAIGDAAFAMRDSGCAIRD
jgi:uncharacterized protein YjbI with pentapeptide repeats